MSCGKNLKIFRTSVNIIRPKIGTRRLDFSSNIEISHSISLLAVNPGIGNCGVVCGDRVRRQNPLGSNVTNFSKSHDVNSTRLTNALTSRALILRNRAQSKKFSIDVRKKKKKLRSMSPPYMYWDLRFQGLVSFSSFPAFLLLFPRA